MLERTAECRADEAAGGGAHVHVHTCIHVQPPVHVHVHSTNVVGMHMQHVPTYVQCTCIHVHVLYMPVQ